VGLVADLDAHNIEKAWLLTWDEPGADLNNVYMGVIDPRNKVLGSRETMIPLNTIIDVCRRYPDRFIAGYCPDPLDPQAVAKLAAAVDILGVRICGEWKFNLHIDDPRCIEIFRFAGSRNLPVVLHLDVPYLPPKNGDYVGLGMWKGGGIDNLIRAMEACPDTNFVGHAPGFWREMSGEADTYPEPYLKPPLAPGGRLPGVFEQFPNLYADLSAGSALRALLADRDNARAFIIRFEDRLLFGRDYYGSELIDFLKSLELPDETWEKIGRGNAEKLLQNTKGPNSAPLRKLISS
jgi:predicted TIM-barrel fold metal-dependent hydrolase